jgi:predicted DNA-binding transcriptional regulator YafY
LDESPLSEDQEIVSLQENRLLVKATVPDSSQLRWWILGHGTQVELLRPESLRDECKSLVAEMNHLYQGSNISKVEN